MNTISLFLNSTENELENDRSSVRSLIDRLNSLIGNPGLCFKLLENHGLSLPCVDRSAMIKSSDMMVMLVYKKLSACAEEDFNTALQSFYDSGHPKIITFFKKNPASLMNG